MKVYNLIKYTITVLLVMVVVLHSCKSVKRIMQADSALESKSETELFEDILQKEIDYNTFSSRITMTVTTGTKTLSSRGSLKMVDNEAILLSIQPLFGIEMFRLHIEPDHFIVLDRMNKRYVKESFDNIEETQSIGFDFYTLQSLFSNRLFVAEKQKVHLQDYKLFKYEEADNNYVMSARDKKSKLDYSFFINGNDQITLAELWVPNKNYSLKWSYDQFSLMGTIFFPHEMEIAAAINKKKLNTALSFSSIDLNESMSLETSIPSGYKKVELKDILKLLADKR